MNPTATPHTEQNPLAFLAGGGEMGERIRAFDWSNTPVGPAATWPQSLKTTVRILLNSCYPMFVWWGRELINIYNDAYIAIHGADHPRTLGQPAPQLWASAWPVIGPQIERVLNEGCTASNESMLLILERYGYPEEAYLTFFYSPVPNDAGDVGGVFCACTEDTLRVFSERQLALLHDLAARTANARTRQEACRQSAAALASNPHDLPFALIYLAANAGADLCLAGASGIETGHPAVPATLGRAAQTPWPLAAVLEARNVVVVEDLRAMMSAPLPTGAWGEPPRQAALAPIAAIGQTGKGGVLIVGLNPFRLFDESYRNFLTLVSGQIVASLASAQAYETPRENEQRFRLMVDNAPVLIWLNDAHNRCEFMNAEYVRFLGRPLDELLGDGWRKSLHPEDAADYYRSFVTAAERRERFEAEFRFRLADGEYRWMRTVGVPRFEGGAYQGYIGSTFDIHERKHAEAALRRSEATFRRLAETNLVGVGFGDSKGNITYINDEMLRMMGYTRADYRAGRINWAACVAPEYREDVVHFGERLMRDGQVVGYERAFLRPDGNRTPYLGAAALVTPGEDLHVSIALDLTKIHIIEATLRQSEERFRKVFENAATGIAIMDWEGRLQQCNPAYATLLGYTMEEIHRRKLAAFLHPADRDGYLAALHRLQAEALPHVEIDNRYLGKAGQIVWVRQFISVLRDDTGKAAYLLTLATDVTERHQTEQALREADRRKDEFLATLAHELRNPLAPLRNGLELMKLTQHHTATGEQTITLMERQLGQMVRLIDDLLDVSRISRGKITLHKERIALAEVVQHALETIRPLIERGNHELTVNVPADPIYVNADVIRLSQVVSNLLDNAAKFTPRGGHIWLTVECRDDEAVVSIRDNGVGIPIPELPKVFDLFAQVKQAMEPTQGGLGIGLALVKQLVEMHGGRIVAKSEGHDTGSEFVMHLPLAPAVGEKRHDLGNVETVGQSTKHRILVVDDNRDAATSLAMMLRIMGNDTQTAYDGLEALDVAATFAPEMVLLDIGMPKLNGYDTARRIREQPWGRQITLVAVTGWGQDEDRRRSQEAGFDFHMVKPIEAAALQKLLAEL